MRARHITVTAAFMSLLTASAFATTPSARVIDWASAEKNYIAAVQSQNIGVQQSAAQFIGEYRLKGAVSELARVLREDPVETTRMKAAASLVRIGGDEALSAVREAVLFDGSEKVARFCEKLMESASEQHDLSMKN